MINLERNHVYLKLLYIQGVRKMLSDPFISTSVHSLLSRHQLRRESCSLKRYCTSVQFNLYTVTQLQIVNYISKQSLLTFVSGISFLNSLYSILHVSLNWCKLNVFNINRFNNDIFNARRLFQKTWKNYIICCLFFPLASFKIDVSIWLIRDG